MNPTDSSSLLSQTARSIAIMLVPVVAFLAILSAVALFAIPTNASTNASANTAKDDRAAPAAKDNATDSNSQPAHVPGARAVRPNKI